MKYIKSINEFRTAGFRYSEPKLGFSISCYYSGEITEEDIENILNKIGVEKYESVSVGTENVTIEYETEEGPVETEVTGQISFDVFLYNEAEIGTLMDEVSRLMFSIFELKTFNYNVREHKENLTR